MTRRPLLGLLAALPCLTLPAPAAAASGAPAWSAPVAPFPASRSLAERALPPPAPVPAVRPRVVRTPGRAGVLRAVPTAGRPRAGARRLLVLVEGGLRVDRRAFALRVERTLNDPRSWGARVSRAGREPADLRVVLARPGLTDRLCAPLLTRRSYSCGTGRTAVLNFRRWREGASAWRGNLLGYRRYLVNHEVGHLLGHGHEGCPARGARAPVMMQQTKGVGACRANPWPRP